MNGREWQSYPNHLPEEQPLPIPNTNINIADLVIADIQERKRIGTERYGTPLQAFNGRSAMRDLYEEILDAAQYVRQVVEEDSFPLMLCNAGCGCRLPNTQYHSDADVRDCACDGPCCWDSWEDFLDDVKANKEVSNDQLNEYAAEQLNALADDWFKKGDTSHHTMHVVNSLQKRARELRGV